MKRRTGQCRSVRRTLETAGDFSFPLDHACKLEKGHEPPHVCDEEQCSLTWTAGKRGRKPGQKNGTGKAARKEIKNETQT